jgi:hypothetical protein
MAYVSLVSFENPDSPSRMPIFGDATEVIQVVKCMIYKEERAPKQPLLSLRNIKNINNLVDNTSSGTSKASAAWSS